ncbi:MAG: hypothetical protein M5U34_00440 [Chloroflexi bacterium]|nr:hypothetical protein [Chloroflexota bacterium]
MCERVSWNQRVLPDAPPVTNRHGDNCSTKWTIFVTLAPMRKPSFSPATRQTAWIRDLPRREIGEWLILLAVLILALWAATQREEAPQLILLATLTVITLNFSLPPERGAVGLTPLVSVEQLIDDGAGNGRSRPRRQHGVGRIGRPPVAAVVGICGFKRPSWRQRLGAGLVYLAALIGAGEIYLRGGGAAPSPRRP